MEDPITNSCGIGLRPKHFEEIVNNISKEIKWIEVHTENFFAHNTYFHQVLEFVASKKPVSFHSVGMSLGSTDPISKKYLKRLGELINLYNPILISDHLAWGSVGNEFFHDLFPVPYNDEAMEVFCNKIDKVQNYLGRQILIENPSLYISFPGSIYQEPDFLNQLALKTGCGVLFDINNLYISSHNLKFDPKLYMDSLDPANIKEIHLAGFEKGPEDFLIDTHSKPISSNVLELFKYFVTRFGPRPTLYEQDQDLQDLKSLINQAQIVDEIMRNLIP